MNTGCLVLADHELRYTANYLEQQIITKNWDNHKKDPLHSIYMYTDLDDTLIRILTTMNNIQLLIIIIPLTNMITIMITNMIIIING